jgi:hypothetical protein
MLTRIASLAEALVRQKDGFPFNISPIDVKLKNGTASATAIGDLFMLDTTSTGLDSALNYIQVIAPTVAGNLAAAGQWHLVAQEVIPASGYGRFRLFGDTLLNLATSSATIGSKIGTNGTALTGEVTTIVTLTKIIGLTKVATTTGVVRVFFNGMPPGLAIAA